MRFVASICLSVCLSVCTARAVQTSFLARGCHFITSRPKARYVSVIGHTSVTNVHNRGWSAWDWKAVLLPLLFLWMFWILSTRRQQDNKVVQWLVTVWQMNTWGTGCLRAVLLVGLVAFHSDLDMMCTRGQPAATSVLSSASDKNHNITLSAYTIIMAVSVFYFSVCDSTYMGLINCTHYGPRSRQNQTNESISSYFPALTFKFNYERNKIWGHEPQTFNGNTAVYVL